VTITEGVASGVAMILVDKKGENSIVVAPGANAKLSPADIDAAESLIQNGVGRRAATGDPAADGSATRSPPASGSAFLRFSIRLPHRQRGYRARFSGSIC